MRPHFFLFCLEARSSIVPTYLIALPLFFFFYRHHIIINWEIADVEKISEQSADDVIWQQTKSLTIYTDMSII